MRQAGFTVIVAKSDDVAAIKRLRGVPEELVSRHTALVDSMSSRATCRQPTSFV
jgi:hypothetical protein